MSETIPLTFEAVDKLTTTVAEMVAILTKLTAAQDDTTDAAKKAEGAQEQQANTTADLADKTIIATGAMEMAGKAFEAAKFIYEGLSEVVSSSLTAWDEQSKKTGMSASALGSVAEASAKTEKAQTKLLAQLGRVIERTGVYQLASEGQRRSMDLLNKTLKDNEDRIAAASQEMAGDFLTTLRDVNEWISTNAETIARLIQFLTTLKDLVGFVVDALGVLVQFLKVEVYAAVTVVTTILTELLGLLTGIIEAAGMEVPQALEDLRLGMEATAKGAKEGLGGALDGLVTQSDEAFESLGKVATGLVATFSEPTEEMKKTEAAIKSATKTANEQIAALEKSLAKARAGGDRARGDLQADPEKVAERQQAIILDYEKRITQARRAGNEDYAIALESEKARYELGLQVAALKTEELKFQTQLNGELNITISEEEKRLAQIERQRAEQRAIAEEQDGYWREEIERDTQRKEQLRARYEEIRELEQQRKDKALETLDAVSAAWESGFGGLGGLLSESLAQDLGTIQTRIDANAELMDQLDQMGQLDDATKTRMIEQNAMLADEMERQAAAAERQIASLERASEAVGILGASIGKVVVLNKSFKDSAEEVSAAMGAGVSLASALVGAFEEDVKKRAAWEAAFNAAAAVAATAFALSGYPGFAGAAIGHAAAAAKFGLVASGVIGAGASSGGGGGAGVASGGGTPNIPTLDLDRERTLNADAIAEAIASTGRGGATVINVNFGESMIIGESPQTSRLIMDRIEPELVRLIGRPG